MKKSRKILSVILAFAMLFVTVPNALFSYAAEKYTVSLSAPSESVEAGETFEIQVEVSSEESDAGVAALSAEISYDASAVEFVDYSEPSESGLEVTASADTAGKVSVGVYGKQQTASGDGAVMAILKFKALKAGEAAFGVEKAVVGVSGQSTDITASVAEAISVEIEESASSGSDNYDLTFGMKNDNLTWTILTVGEKTVNRELSGGQTVENIAAEGVVITFRIDAPDNVQYINVQPHITGSTRKPKSVNLSEDKGIYTLVMPSEDYSVDATTLKIPESDEYTINASFQENAVVPTIVCWNILAKLTLSDSLEANMRVKQLRYSQDGGENWSTSDAFTRQDSTVYMIDLVSPNTMYSPWSSVDYWTIENRTVIFYPEISETGITSIATEDDLLDFAQAVNDGDKYTGVTVTLQNDILLTRPWTESIGISDATPFGGTFDGNGHTISGLDIDYIFDVSDANNQNARDFGLFGRLSGATIKDLTVVGTIDVDDPVTAWYAEYNRGRSRFGGIAAYAIDSNFSGCETDVDITAHGGHIGGMVGGSYRNSFTDCFNYGNLEVTKRNSSVCGIASYESVPSGGSSDLSFLRCGNYGNITVGGERIKRVNTGSQGSTSSTTTWEDLATGYAAGLAFGAENITECFNKGSIKGIAASAGGLLIAGSVTDSYNAGTVELTSPNDSYYSSSSSAGGLICTNANADPGAVVLKNCYNSGSVSNVSSKGVSGLLYGNKSMDFTVVDCYTAETDPPVSAITAELLNGTGRTVWKDDANNINGGSPLLYWESDSASDERYPITFDTGDIDAEITVYSDAAHQNRIESEDGSYQLPAGTYYYTAQAKSGGYAAAEGSFTVVRRAVTVDINFLEIVRTQIAVSPADADFQLKSGSGSAVEPDSKDGGVYTYTLNKGSEYTYTATASGYNGVTSGFTAGAQDSISVTLTKSSYDPGASEDQYIYGSYNTGKKSTITSGGTYYVKNGDGRDGAQGTITINTTDPVTLVGTGISTADAYEYLFIDCIKEGTDLTLRDIYISNVGEQTDTEKIGNLIDFTGDGNSLTWEGTSILDFDQNAAGYAMIHVNQNTELTMGGADESDTIYMYKREQGAGVGGNGGAKGADGQTAETNGQITVTGGTMFIKNSKQGAFFGAGAESASKGLTPGDIYIDGGVLNIIANSRGAAIGGSAGAGGASSGSNVYVSNATININVDFSGAAIGGGGYESGNDSGGGTLHYTSGSIRTYIDQNAIANWDVSSAGINGNKAITADIVNDDGDPLYLLMLDTGELGKQSSSYTVKDGSSVIYRGGLHEYRSVNEASDKGSQTEPAYTIDNWTSLDDSNLYLYLTGEDHTLTVNDDETVTAKWDAGTETFTLTYSSGATAGGAGTTETYGDITLVTGSGGKASIDKTEAKTGDTVTITASPDKGYETESVSVTDEDGKAVSVKDNGDGTWSFVKPEGAVTIRVTFAALPAETPDVSAFTDISPDSWYYDAVAYVVANSLFNGVSETQFAPDSTMTRAMFITVLGRLEGIDTSKYPSGSFGDVPSGTWYSPYVQWASENGIVEGVGGNSFNPSGQITREQMAVIMYRYAQFKGIDVSVTDSSRFESFTDKDSVSSYAKEAMIWATANGIINGTDVGLEPQKNASRAQVAQIIKNYSEKIISVPESE